MESSGWNMYVFRDGKRTVTGKRLVSDAVRALQSCVPSDIDSVLQALIATGELECALADSGSGSVAEAARITDGVSRLLVGLPTESLPDQAGRLSAIEPPPEVQIAVLEGFAYYALHPEKLIRVLGRLPHASRAGVIGIRSIGAPLSSVVAMALRARGSTATRITVRPAGHPYERTLELSRELREFVDANRKSPFVIVDEGPGISGSSFLAVAEALGKLGIADSQISMIGSRQVEPSQLQAPDAALRWPRYRFHCTDPEPIAPDGAGVPLSGGLWRRQFLTDFTDQPACWPQLEMAKFLSDDKQSVYRFEGFGHYGEEIAERSRALAEAGFGPAFYGNTAGFGRYRILRGKVLTRQDVSTAILRRMAEYCAFRCRNLIVSSAENTELIRMARWNWQCELGAELANDFQLGVEYPVISDARMLPHEWIETGSGFVKTDASSHGDNHFFPGPCDIAWDLAGAIVEWDLSDEAAQYFIEIYKRLSGDDARARLGSYCLAYTLFRMGWSKMAAQASVGEFDEALLLRDYGRYREKAVNWGRKFEGINERQSWGQETAGTSLRSA